MVAVLPVRGRQNACAAAGSSGRQAAAGQGVPAVNATEVKLVEGRAACSWCVYIGSWRVGRHRRCHAGCAQLSRARLQSGEAQLAGLAATVVAAAGHKAVHRLLAAARMSCQPQCNASAAALSCASCPWRAGTNGAPLGCIASPSTACRKPFNCCSALRELQAVGHGAVI